jgi:predicted AlkP superfamily pyrophosphatase or phosphodiesterase
MNGKVILVIMDGVGYETALACCGFLEGTVELGRARRWKMRAALPTRSAPLYETLHTGLAPAEHGLTANEALRPSPHPNVFATVRAAGGRTAAVAHAWYFTLYNGRAYDLIEDVEIDDEEAAGIQHGRFYSQEGYGRVNACAPAEIDLCAQLTLLLRRHDPHYALLHTCSADTLGHAFTANSAEYREQTWRIDNALSRTLPLWLALGYEIFVTADHGMNNDGHHGGTASIERDVAFYYFGPSAGPDPSTVLDQLSVAPSSLARIGAPIPDSMRAPMLFR